MIQARHYQHQCVRAVLDGFQEFDRQLVVLPTGSGKTVIMGMLCRELHPNNVLVLAHREELIQQNADKVKRVTGLPVTIERGAEIGSRVTSIVVGSIQTLMRRCQQWDAHHFRYVFVDECHLILAESYQKVLQHFSGARVLGMTATPSRSDRKELASFFENVPYELGIFDLINQGFLSKIMVQTVPISIDLNRVRTVAGDFDDHGLDEALSPYFEEIVKGIVEFCADRKTLVFLPLVKTSQAFVEVCKRHGLLAAHVHGQSPDRADILARFERGDFQILSNASLLTEGVDIPSISCVCILRPTKSHAAFSQMIGRGARLSEGKPNLLLLDFLYQYQKHGLVRPAHLIAKTEEETLAITAASRDGSAHDLQDLAEDFKRRREEALRKQLQAHSHASANRFDAQDFALITHNYDLEEYEPVFAWEKSRPSEKQLKTLVNFGFNAAAITSKGMASKLISACIERRAAKLATPKQMIWLRKMNHPDPGNATFMEASAFLDQAFNRRRNPVHVTLHESQAV